jgi:ankyrin repeat protein
MGSIELARRLLELVLDDDVAGVLDAFARGADVDARETTQGLTPLMHAVRHAGTGVEMVRLLIARGADVVAVADDYGLRPVLSFAAGSGSVAKVAALLDAGADLRYVREPHGYDVLIDALHGRDIARDPELVPRIELLLARGARPDRQTSYRESAVGVASHCGRFDAVRVLIAAGADPALLRWTPLHRAIALGTLADVQREIDAGADIEARDLWTRTPWLLAVQTGDVDKARALLAAGAERSARGSVGRTALMHAIGDAHAPTLAWLLAAGFDVDEADDFQHTPLMLAAETGAAECARLLVAAGADIHRVDHVGESAISQATSLDVVRLLVAHGADLNDISDGMRAALTGVRADGRIRATIDDYAAGRQHRFGTANPERMDEPFWRAMVASGAAAWAARHRFAPGGDGTACGDGPVWCFHRFGKSINVLPDGRIIEVAGEHEDHYDPDFCIYNDVIVHRPDGTFAIYGYPRAIFPPTDFHTATLVGTHLWLIGNLGYRDERRYGDTQVLRLDVASLAIERVDTTGAKPGWISRHKATLAAGGAIEVAGGKVCAIDAGKEAYLDHPGHWSLDLSTLRWRRIASDD